MLTLSTLPALLAASSLDFEFDNFKKILGGVLGLMLLIAFVAAIAQIAWHYFVSRGQGGADMEIIWRKVIGLAVVILFSLIWTGVFGTDFLVDATVDGFDGIEGGGGGN